MSQRKLKALAAALPLQRFCMHDHELYMNRCLELAAFGSGFAAPNPLVGAVLVHEGRIIGEGWHRMYGQAHAEVNCLGSVKESQRHLIPESTLYVSLEPCAHYGKTPPCALRIIQEGIGHVVIGAGDPFAGVNGKGILLLQQAGIKVEAGILPEKCRWQNRRFFTFHEKGRPYVHLKWAETGDGFISAKDGERLAITHPVTNRMVHKWRSEEAAILVGTNTALLDNPKLNNRYWPGAQPQRVLVDRNLRVPASHHLLSDQLKTIILNAQKDEQEGMITRVKVDNLEGRNPEVILQALYKMNIQSVFIEGGAALLESFLEAGLWDELHILKNSRLQAGSGTRAPNFPQGQGIRKQEKNIGRFDKMEWWVNK